MLGDLVSLSDFKAWAEISGNTLDTMLARLITQTSQQVYSMTGRDVIVPRQITETYRARRGRIILNNWPASDVTLYGEHAGLIPQASALGPGVAVTDGYVLEPPDDRPPGSMQGLTLRGGQYFLHRDERVTVTYTAGYRITAELQTATNDPSPKLVTAQPYGPWASHMSAVRMSDGLVMALVTTAPAAGQIQVDPNTLGGYILSAADEGQTVALTYGYIPADLASATLDWVTDRYRFRARGGQVSKTLGGQETVSWGPIKDMPDSVKTTLSQYTRILTTA